MNEDTKSIFASKTFWGTLITLLSGVVPQLHVSSDAAAVYATNLALIGGAVLAIYGRVVADKKVTLTGKK